MDWNYGYCDLNIPLNCDPSTNVVDLLRTAFTLGYSTVAINTEVGKECLASSKALQKGKKRKRNENDDDTSTADQFAAAGESGDGSTNEIPKPASITLADVGQIPNPKNLQRRILHRLTVELDDRQQCHKLMGSDNVGRYDLLAILPTTESALQHAIQNLKIDIIAFDADSKPLPLTRKLYGVAIQRGIHFELTYSRMIGNTLD